MQLDQLVPDDDALERDTSDAGPAASRVLKERREAIASRLTALYFEARPQLERRWKGARQKCAEDNRYHIDYLCEALAFGRPDRKALSEGRSIAASSYRPPARSASLRQALLNMASEEFPSSP